MKVKDVRKKMLSKDALKGISIFFDADHIHGIIGPNGAGKTTLMRLMACLLKPTQGGIVFLADGEETPSSEVKSKIGYFPQEQSLYSDLSCMEHLEFFAKLYNIESSVFRQRSDELLKIAGLKKFSDRKAGELSGGMYKKLGLICVLLNRPKLLLLDEPTIGVDPLSRVEIWDLIYELSSDMTVILSTSYMDEAQKCQRAHILNEGRLMASDSPDEIVKSFDVDKIEDIFHL